MKQILSCFRPDGLISQTNTKCKFYINSPTKFQQSVSGQLTDSSIGEQKNRDLSSTESEKQTHTEGRYSLQHEKDCVKQTLGHVVYMDQGLERCGTNGTRLGRHLGQERGQGACFPAV